MSEISDLYKQLVQNANTAVLSIDANFIFIDCNHKATELFGRPKEEILGITPSDPLISTEYQANGELSSVLGHSKFKSAMQGQDMQFEWMHVKPDGTELPVEVSLLGFDLSDSRNVFVILKDLTQIKKKERALIDSEERFRTLFENATDSGVLILPSSAEITHCNIAACKILGYDSEEDLLGKTVFDISPETQENGESTSEVAAKFIAECLDTGQSRLDWIHLTKDGSAIYFDIALTRIKFHDQVYIHALWRDVTEIRKTRRELIKHRNSLEEMVKERTAELENTLEDLKSTQSHLIQAEKMASLGVLTAGVAHEINNPLNFILGSYSGLLDYFKEQEIEDELVDVLLDSLKKGVDRATDIVQSLNQFSRTNSSNNEDCDIHFLLDNCLLILNHQIKKGINVTKNYNVEQPVIKGNVGKLHQVFLNVLTNAIHAVHGSGNISIITNIGKDLEVTISDNGKGIPAENINKVTDPFFTTKGPGQGTGLGLSITYTIIEEHSGSLEITSEQNFGTMVKITLPIDN
jgi:PAS domain S-box-containing protein